MTETVEPVTAPKLSSYHFDVGNSTDGPIGFCARIVAESEAAALARLRSMLSECVELVDYLDDEYEGEEYLNVYFNDQKISVDDIDEVEPYSVEED